MKKPLRPGVFTIEDEIRTVTLGRPHVIVLGAGASRAAFPQGDKSGNRLPVMKDFVDVLELRGLLQSSGVPEPYDDFEALYCDIHGNPALDELRKQIETRVESYFGSLALFDRPTIYDHLVLSLRPKDVIATFNWDPFLWKACARNRGFSELPHVLFLHGNVATAHCPRCKIVTSRKSICADCGSALVPTPLLFPVKEKDYQSDPSIAAHWEKLQMALKHAWAITVFGYGAPKTDVSAVGLMKGAWGVVDKRSLEETEIIDIRAEAELTQIWAPFIHTHHYRCVPSFYDSLLARHPRRSGEALWACLMDCLFLDGIDFPKDADFDGLYEFLEPRLIAEQESAQNKGKPKPAKRRS